jgi:hypothetical protein
LQVMFGRKKTGEKSARLRSPRFHVFDGHPLDRQFHGSRQFRSDFDFARSRTLPSGMTCHTSRVPGFMPNAFLTTAGTVVRPLVVSRDSAMNFPLDVRVGYLALVAADLTRPERHSFRTCRNSPRLESCSFRSRPKWPSCKYSIKPRGTKMLHAHAGRFALVVETVGEIQPRRLRARFLHR